MIANLTATSANAKDISPEKNQLESDGNLEEQASFASVLGTKKTELKGDKLEKAQGAKEKSSDKAERSEGDGLVIDTKSALLHSDVALFAASVEPKVDAPRGQAKEGVEKNPKTKVDAIAQKDDKNPQAQLDTRNINPKGAERAQVQVQDILIRPNPEQAREIKVIATTMAAQTNLAPAQLNEAPAPSNALNLVMSQINFERRLDQRHAAHINPVAKGSLTQTLKTNPSTLIDPRLSTAIEGVPLTEVSLGLIKDVGEQHRQGGARPALPDSSANTFSGLMAHGMSANAAQGSIPQQPVAAPSPLSTIPITQQHAWNQALGQQLIHLASTSNGKEQHAQLRLDPPELGPLRVNLTMHDSVVHVVFTTANAQVRTTLEGAMSQLAQSFEDAGIELGQSHVDQEELAHKSEQPDVQPFAHARTNEDRGESEQDSSIGIRTQATDGRISTYA